MTSVNYKTIDLFAGIGGIRLGFEKYGCKTVFSVRFGTFRREFHDLFSFFVRFLAKKLRNVKKNHKIKSASLIWHIAQSLIEIFRGNTLISQFFFSPTVGKSVDYTLPRSKNEKRKKRK